MRIAILQSSYIPWKGYFDIIGSVDVFVVYDDVQYSKNHWHNRNLIKTQHGIKWLTVPVSKAEGAFQKIEDVSLPTPFAQNHWRAIQQAYSRTAFFGLYGPPIAALYDQAAGVANLSQLNVLFLKAITSLLGFKTRFIQSRDLGIIGGRTARLAGICRALGATHYISGPSARAYLDEVLLDRNGIAVEWMDYSGYPPYTQLHGEFSHQVSILDLIFNTGPDALSYMKAGRANHE
ncbi:WbqC family protein [Bosea sp. R86505]|uniref:WbqC family protein n=1 Tax=Bosea sp. R86505 TaxID=3101710 RepID=UPI003670D952